MVERQKRRKSNVIRNTEMRKNEKSGVSLIALVITIIVVIILAAIMFGTSTRTITNANYSDYVNNVSEVYNAFHRRAVTIKGQEAAKGNNVTDAQVYNYLASNSNEFLVRADLPDYTIIEDEEQIGMKLPKMVVESGTGKMVAIKYAVTNAGDIFTWPPFDYEDGFQINDSDNAETKLSTTISVKGNSLGIKLDMNTGELLDSIAENSIKNLVKTEVLKIGDYINYNTYLSGDKTYISPSGETGYTSDQTLTANTSVGWRVIYMDSSKIWIVPAGAGPTTSLRGAVGYIQGPGELNKICRELYSSNSLGTTASNMTIDQLETALGATSDGATKLAQAKASYVNDYSSNSGEGGIKEYTSGNCWIKNSNGVSGGTEGNSITGTSLKYYNASDTSSVTAIQTSYSYNLSSVNSAVGNVFAVGDYWLASPCVSLYTSFVYFNMRFVKSNEVSDTTLIRSVGSPIIGRAKVCPLVSLPSSLQLDANGKTSHTSQTNAWKIIH